MKKIQPSTGVDSIIFYGSLSILIVFSVPLFIWPEWSISQLGTVRTYIDNHLGYLYQWLAIFLLGFALWVSFSKAGRMRLGKGKPSFNTYSWASMIFCAGVATGILYWGGIEWAYYVMTPPLNVEPFSNEAIEWAATYGMFHWGPIGWAFYSVPALAIGHAYYNLGLKSMRLSLACSGILGKYAEGTTGKVIDIIFMVGLLGSSGTSLGIGTPMVAASVDQLFGTGTHFGVKLIIILFCSIIFAFSVYLGLSKGIKRLSNINTGMAFIFLGLILLLGPTVFILKMFTNSLGLMGQNFLRMITWTDPLVNSGFVEDWSIFYWSWWTAVGPFMGIFIARISKGRSFKQVVLGTLLFGSAGSAIFYGIFGNYALFQEISGVLKTTDLIQVGEATSAIPQIIQNLPMGMPILGFFAIMCLVFMATSFDSTSYVLATCVTNKLERDEEPAQWVRLFWAFVLVILPIGLMFIGGLEALKTTVLLSALPLILIYIFIIFSLIKWINQHTESNEH